MADDAADLTRSVTVLFADISGSTGMYATRGDVAAYRLTSRCLELLEERVRQAQGRIIKRIGDAILAAFESAEPAVSAAINMQQALEDPACDLWGEGVRVRIGIASGSAVIDAGDVFGDVVNVAARLESLAGADEIFLADATYAALPETMRARARLIDQRALRGRPDSMGVYEYLWQAQPDGATIASTDRTRTYHTVIELQYRAASFVIPERRTKVSIGRDADNDISIADDVVSRHHADIVMRGDKFLLVDRSTNGTYVLTDRGEKFRVSREELTLTGGGRIFPGSKKLQPVSYRLARR